MPSTQGEAIEAVEAIQTGDTRKWITVYEQPETRIREGDWRPCQFLDPVLVDAAMQLEQADGLVPLQNRYFLGPLRPTYSGCVPARRQRRRGLPRVLGSFEGSTDHHGGHPGAERRG